MTFPLHLYITFVVWFCAYGYRDAEILGTVSPPFVEVALQAFDHPEISQLLRDPQNYNPNWGKRGIALSVIYYVRNARMAVQHITDRGAVSINGDGHQRLWSKIFKWEMDIFSSFIQWHDNQRDASTWTQFAHTVHRVLDGRLRPILYALQASNFNVDMAVWADYALGPKWLSVDDAHKNSPPSDREFDPQLPFIPTLPNGFPLIGFGSWPMTGAQCKDAVAKALQSGYRLIDSSENYNNEEVIGEAIRESGIDRSQILIASKLSHERNYGDGVTTEAFHATLQRLGVDSIDVYMLHGAIGDKQRLRAAWQQLEVLYEAGKIKYLGVSNFAPNDMEQLLSYATVKPMFVQNKYDPFTQGQQAPWTASIDEWAYRYNEQQQNADDKILVQGYSILNAWPNQIHAVQDKHAQWIASKYEVSTAQLLLRWALQHPMVGILTRSTDERRQVNNLDVFSFAISDIDMQLLNGLITLFSPFDVQWMHDVYGQVGNRPPIDPHQEL